MTAHPELASFNFALADAAAETFVENSWAVKQTRLYQEGFSLAPGRADFNDFPQDQPFRLLRAQCHADRYGGFEPRLAQEQRTLNWLELLFLQFPLWWGSYPAILKGWMERVLSYGFAYGRTATLAPKEVILSVTTGGAESDEEEQEYLDRLDRMADDVFGYMRWTIHPHLIAHAPDRASDHSRRRLLQSHRSRIRTLIEERTT